jgi:hypothetical protein
MIANLRSFAFICGDSSLRLRVSAVQFATSPAISVPVLHIAAGAVGRNN